MARGDMPQKGTGVYSRKDSKFWWWHIKTPKDLKPLYKSFWAHTCSLETSDLREANRLAAQLRAKWLDTFDQQRKRLKDQTGEPLTPEMGRYLARKLLHDTLAREDVRVSPDWRKDLLRYHTHIGLVGMQATAAEAGIVLDEKTPGVKEAWLHYVNELKEPLRAQLAEQPQMPKPPQKARTLRDVFDRWKVTVPAKEGEKVPEHVRNKKRWLELYEQQTGNPPLHELTRDQGEAFRAWLLQDRSDVSDTKKDWSSKRKHTVLDDLKSLLNYAEQALNWIVKNPWRGLDIRYETKNKRRPMRDAELQAIFGQPLFTKYELPKATAKNGGAAAYWLPLLGMFTGARVSELAPLRVRDLVHPEGIPCISINEDGEGKRLKTPAAEREIPLHPELVRLGFMDYVADMKKAGGDRLFPALEINSTRAGTYFSTWFAEESKRLAPEGSRHPTLHYFRHGMQTKLARARVPTREIRAIIGHEQEGVGDEVYTEFAPDMLLESLTKIDYPVLDLPRVYKPKN